MDWGDSDDGGELKINETFANKYETKKRGEELSKLQDKYGKDYTLSDDDGEDSEEDLSDDDEDAEFVTPQVDVAILKTLAKIKSRDPAVYDSSRAIFDEEEGAVAVAPDSLVSKKGKNKDKPVLLKDYQRKRLLEDPDGTNEDSVAPTPAQEQARLKEETKKAFLEAVSDNDDDKTGSDNDDDALLVRKDKSDKERNREEREYQEFLKSTAGQQAIETALDKDEEFLNDYILKRGWVENDDRDARGRGDTGMSDVESGGDDSDFDDRAEQFETAYNFRFEDPNAAAVVTHARTVPSVRKPTTQQSARARARQAAKEREEEEKVRRKEEVRRLRALKRKEIEDKLVKLAEAAGEGTAGLENIDLEGDWDPAKHDEAMRKVYGSDYEGEADNGFKPRLSRGDEGDDDGDEDEDGKPTWKDDIDISDLNIPEVDDDEAAQAIAFGNVDGQAEDDAEFEQEEVVQASEKKKGKKRKRDDEFDTELVEAAKQGADEGRKAVVDGLLDSYYQVDYEDKVGDLKTRFHYTKVAPSTYGLSPVEILLASDAELNSFMSLRKLAPYRTKDDKKNKKRLKELRDKLKTREWGREPVEGDERQQQQQSGGQRDKKRRKTGGADGEGGEAKEKKKRKGRKERNRLKAAAAAGGEEGAES